MLHFQRETVQLSGADFSLISSGPFRLSSLVRERGFRREPLIFGRNNNEAGGRSNYNVVWQRRDPSRRYSATFSKCIALSSPSASPVQPPIPTVEPPPMIVISENDATGGGFCFVLFEARQTSSAGAARERGFLRRLCLYFPLAHDMDPTSTIWKNVRVCRSEKCVCAKSAV